MKTKINKPLKIQSSLLARNTLLNLISQGLPLVVAVVTISFAILFSEDYLEILEKSGEVKES